MSHRYHYTVYGLRLASSREIPGLIPNQATEFDFEIEFRGLDASPPDPVHASWETMAERVDDTGSSRTIMRSAHLRGYRVRYGDGTDFRIDEGESRITVHWLPAGTFEDTLAYFLGPILGFVLRRRGVLCLHGSAVVRHERALALVGPGGAGKSTTAAALAVRGEPVLSDDLVALRRPATDFLVSPGYSRLRLWPESGTMLFGQPDALPPISSNWDKRFLDLRTDGRQFAAEPRPLSAIYLLDDQLGDAMGETIEPVNGRDALFTLIANTYPDHAMLDTVVRAREHQELTSLAASVAVRRVRRTRDPQRLAALVDSIIRDFDALHAAAAPTA